MLSSIRTVFLGLVLTVTVFLVSGCAIGESTVDVGYANSGTEDEDVEVDMYRKWGE